MGLLMVTVIFQGEMRSNVNSLILPEMFQLALLLLHDAAYDPDNYSIGSGAATILPFSFACIGLLWNFFSVVQKQLPQLL